MFEELELGCVCFLSVFKKNKLGIEKYFKWTLALKNAVFLVQLG